MKKITIPALCILLVVSLLAGCGGANSSASGQGSPVSYAELIRSARSEEENQVFPLSSAPGDENHEIVFQVLGGTDENMERYAVSVGAIITKAYGVAIVLPKAGQEQAVKEQLSAYVETQEKAFEHYLQDQYQIAKNAKIETADTGEILLVMAAEGGALMEELKAGLAAR